MQTNRLLALKVNTVGAAVFIAIGGLFWSAGAVSDAQAQTNAQPLAPAANAQPLPVALPPGVDDVLKLARGGIGEDVILAKIKNDGASYNLTSDQIIYLSKAGVSQNVLAALLLPPENAAPELEATGPLDAQPEPLPEAVAGHH